MPTYLLTGGTGLIGRAIINKLQQQHHSVIVLTRDIRKAQTLLGEQVTVIDDLELIPEAQQIDCVINLAGAPIADKRWSDSQKAQLRVSRITLTEQLVAWLTQRSIKPESLISGSAVGWYGDQGKEALTERSDFKDDFAHQLCDAWEQAALKAQAAGIRVALVRTGLVIAADGGFLKKMLPPFKLGLGGPIATGEQMMPWIHLDDIRDLFLFLAQNNTIEGVFNGTAPHPVTNAEFTKTLASVLNRPAFFRVPACVLKLGFGEMSALLLGGQNALPEKARTAGFQFSYTALKPALTHAITSGK